jgi:hypothetical protein
MLSNAAWKFVPRKVCIYEEETAGMGSKVVAVVVQGFGVAAEAVVGATEEAAGAAQASSISPLRTTRRRC